MPEVSSEASAPLTARAIELFRQHRDEIFRATDQLFVRLMLAQWVACIIVARGFIQARR